MNRAAAMLKLDYDKVKYTGHGVCIGFADTGIAPHPDFFDENGFRVKAYKDFVDGRETVSDDGGHGTHVCGIACGNGAASGGMYRGIAMNADIAVARVLDRNGNGKLSNMTAALYWFLDIRSRVNLKIVNLSFSVNQVKADEYKKFEEVINRLWKSGIVVVCAAGNNGPAFNSVTAPGSISNVITVGAADDELTAHTGSGNVSHYSGRGRYKNIITKPELCAPATNIMSCEYKFLENSDCFINNANRNKLYSALSGTSMAAPMIAGISALLLEKNNFFTPDEVKTILMNSCVSLNKPACVQGAGMPDLSRIFR